MKRITRHAVRGTHADEAGGKLIEIGFPNGNRTSLEQALHDEGGFGRRGGEPGASRRRGHAGQVDVVLDRKRHAVERLRGESARLDPPGVREQFVPCQAMNPHRQIAVCFEPPPDFFDERGGRERTGGVGRAERGEVEGELHERNFSREGFEGEEWRASFWPTLVLLRFLRILRET